MTELLQVYNPFNNLLIDEVQKASENEINEILSKAESIAKDPAKLIPPYQRIQILEKIAKMMALKVEELTMIAAEEGGKPYIDSKIEVERAINGVKLAISSLYGLKGEEIP